ncbi:hypothetical protein CAEBREN_32703 [Caenorhabditis brenneri]|uniref:Uncharacterized protein n=1 Tax=Caenorhabditis brenneri TaxID=135651 RepID=G0MFN5_CAEBE|nr:hypothetical protein CAEBREN_32703 [Caenorhabditis brenneri]
MSHSDDDYPELDVSTDGNENALTAADGYGEVVGAPPSSDVESDESAYHTPSSEENVIRQYEYNECDLYDSGSEEFDVEGYENEQLADLHIHDMSSYVDVGNEQESNAAHNFQEFEDSNKEIFQVLLPSAMIASIEHMTIGFEPSVINDCLKDVGYCLEVVAMMLLGAEKFATIPRAPVDWCHALKDANHLLFENGKFYPRVPESLRAHCTSLIEGASRLSQFEEKKKKEQETYKSEEFELRVLYTFNMIAELLNAVRDEQRQLKIGYSHLMNAYQAMVEGLKYHDIFKRYKGTLSLNDPKKLWNSQWFNEYTGRSSLMKFIHMARFSEIAVTNTNPRTYYFRADDDVPQRDVKLFIKKDFDEVREKWRSGNQANRNFGRNYGAGGQRGEGRGPSQQKKKTIEQDPNYKSARFNGLMDGVDDGSLEPSTSTRYNRERSPPRPIRNRSLSPRENRSPIPARSPSPFDEPTSQAQEQAARPSSPESQSDPPQRVALSDPFGGRPVQRREETNFGGSSDNQLTRDNYGRNRAGEVRRIDVHLIGETSSEGEITSDGSYSNEDEDTKQAKRERRLAVKKKKDEREMRRRKQHEENRNKPIEQTRFSVSQFKKKTPQNAPRSPERRRQESPLPFEDEPTTSTEPLPPVELPVEEPTPVQTTTADSDDEPLPVRPQATNKAPAVVTDTMTNALSHQAQVPYRPSALDVQKKKMEQEEKAKKASMNAVKKYGADAVLAYHPALFSQNSGPGPSSSPLPPPQAYIEPEPPSGFGNSQRFVDYIKRFFV